jgi:hypothetical protein
MFLFISVFRIFDKTQTAKEDRSYILSGRMDTKIKRRNASSCRLHYASSIQLYLVEEILCFVFDGLFLDA